MTYLQAIQYLESFINYEKIVSWPYKKSLKLERFRAFLKLIGNPQDSLRCLHIAGTKGKGSTCAFIAYILREAGFKTGLYTSPHLSDFRERIRVLRPKDEGRGTKDDFEGMISKNEISALTERLKPAIEKYNRASKYGPLSFFEVYTALGFLYFKEKKADLVVLETGLGGRLDATNVVNPLVCAITPISYEHTQKLGNTLRGIATEKAGIIKVVHRPSSIVYRPIVISAPQEKEAIEVIRQRCAEAGAKLYEVGKDIKYEIKGSTFNIQGVFGRHSNLKTTLIGRHQVVNAAVAIGVVEGLCSYNIDVGSNSLRKGILQALWPGRCEIISRRPSVVLDGAQNIASVRALKETIRDNFQYEKLILVLGISRDKDIKGMCRNLYDLPDTIILTKAGNPRAAEPVRLKKYFPGRKNYLTQNVNEAKALASRIAKKDDLILACGSLFVVGEFRNGKIRPQ